MFKKNFLKGAMFGLAGYAAYNTYDSFRDALRADRRYCDTLTCKYVHRALNYIKYNIDRCEVTRVKQHMQHSTLNDLLVTLEGKLMSGEDFNEIFQDNSKVKFFNESRQHYDIKYLGNAPYEDIFPIAPIVAHNIPGGLCFFVYEKECEMAPSTRKFKAQVSVPNDTYVFVLDSGRKMCKAEKLIIGEIQPNVTNDTNN